MGAAPIASRIGGAPEILEALRPQYSPFKPNLLVRLSKKVEALTLISREEVWELGYELKDIVMKKFNNDDVKRKILSALLE
jgi:hypothetical protein